MRFKHQQRSVIPTIDLTPMLNVMMATLAFFVLVSMTLTNEQGVNIQLPAQDNTISLENAPPLLVEFKEKQILLDQQQVTKQQLLQQMRVYLQQNPQGSVLLQPDSKLPYELVVQLLGEMRDVGGDRVSLAID
ncbi:ExbD/TolR family protein [Chroogloeocystis siderophila]|jgi:biopolymer transport protein ExbD|uniref:Biopolymer transporter ExbD n=1 Tax=Chroogloeocystis siderophila 5.2 s.c.1 TaxID=247279 RepID=A0A1U7HU40_9CHRO|nr:biopolymer transporter ExbD [Chroogloeocystis siderophila]OKH27045.1 biopolymer transporter ExbD [Chroogloeocystis siderophila 5.2 s.c.1]